MSIGGGAQEAEVTQEERQLAITGAEQWNDYQENFVPLENSFIAQLTPTKGERSMQKGIATSEVAQSFKGLDQKVVAGSKGQGSQGKSIFARAGLNDKVGEARAEAAIGTDKALRDRELGGLAKMSAFGRDLQDMNSVTLRGAASDATSAAINKANVDAQNDSSLATLVGTAAGTYLGHKDNVDMLKKKWGFGGPKKIP